MSNNLTTINRKSWLPIVLSAIVLLFVFWIGYNLGGNAGEIKTIQIVNLNTQITNLNAQIISLNSEISSLKDQIVVFKGEIVDLKKTNTLLLEKLIPGGKVGL